MGVMNAHTPYYFPFGNNASGRALQEIIEVKNLIIFNYGYPTFGGAEGPHHFHVFINMYLRFSDSSESSDRLRMNKVDWIKFSDLTKETLRDIPQNHEASASEKYNNFAQALISNLKDAGAYVPREKSEKSSLKPLWWNEGCEEISNRKKKMRKKYISKPSETNLNLYLEVKAETNRILGESKKKAFRELCSSINPRMGSKRIWGFVKPFQGKLPLEGMNHLRKIFNECFMTASFPDSWKTSLVKFIPKPARKWILSYHTHFQRRQIDGEIGSASA